MKRTIMLFAVIAVAAASAFGEQRISAERDRQRHVGQLEDFLGSILSIGEGYALLDDAPTKVLEAVQRYYLDNLGNPDAINPYGAAALGRLASTAGKGFSLASMTEDYISLGNAAFAGNRADFVDGADSLIRKSCSALGSAVGVAAAVGLSGILATTTLPATAAAAALVGGAMVFGAVGSWAGKRYYDDLFGLSISAQMKDALGSLYDFLFGAPAPEPAGEPCMSCMLQDLVGTCSSPRCPNYGRPHRDYRP